MVKLHTFKTASACTDDKRDDDTDTPRPNRFRVSIIIIIIIITTIIIIITIIIPLYYSYTWNPDSNLIIDTGKQIRSISVRQGGVHVQGGGVMYLS